MEIKPQTLLLDMTEKVVYEAIKIDISKSMGIESNSISNITFDLESIVSGEFKSVVFNDEVKELIISFELLGIPMEQIIRDEAYIFQVIHSLIEHKVGNDTEIEVVEFFSKKDSSENLTAHIHIEQKNLSE